MKKLKLYYLAFLVLAFGVLLAFYFMGSSTALPMIIITIPIAVAPLIAIGIVK